MLSESSEVFKDKRVLTLKIEHTAESLEIDETNQSLFYRLQPMRNIKFTNADAPEDIIYEVERFDPQDKGFLGFSGPFDKICHFEEEVRNALDERGDEFGFQLMGSKEQLGEERQLASDEDVEACGSHISVKLKNEPGDRRFRDSFGYPLDYMYRKRQDSQRRNR